MQTSIKCSSFSKNWLATSRAVSLLENESVLHPIPYSAAYFLVSTIIHFIILLFMPALRLTWGFMQAPADGILIGICSILIFLSLIIFRMGLHKALFVRCNAKRTHQRLFFYSSLPLFYRQLFLSMEQG